MPREFRVAGPEVHLRRVPECILIVERDPWEVCLEACRELSDEFFTTVEKRGGELLQKRVWWWEEQEKARRTKHGAKETAG